MNRNEQVGFPRIGVETNFAESVVLEKFYVITDGAQVTFDALADIKDNVRLAKPVTAGTGVKLRVVSGVYENLHDKSLLNRKGWSRKYFD